ncbi:hypothetical protein HZC20_03110 [Candidatus Peregrinibacteria bacterium]|nr:hypothetical protein [Candidatus Peregrinibacteria bacterium]
MNLRLKNGLRIILQFMLLMIAIFTILHFQAFAVDKSLPIPSAEYEKYNIPKPPDKEGQLIVKDLVLGGLAYVKAIVVAIGILMISLLGLRLLMAYGEEEEISKARRGLIYALIAFVIISMSQDFGKIFDMGEKSLLQSPQNILNRVKLFDKEIEIFMTFIKYVIGAYAGIMILRYGIGLVTAGGNEEEATKNKKGIMYAMGGLLMTYFSQTFIDKVFYKINKDAYYSTGVHPGVDVKAGVEQISGITNMVMQFVAPIALVMFIVTAIMYATAAGKDEQVEKAKRLLTATIIGVVIIYGAFAVVSTIIASKLGSIDPNLISKAPAAGWLPI